MVGPKVCLSLAPELGQRYSTSYRFSGVGYSWYSCQKFSTRNAFAQSSAASKGARLAVHKLLESLDTVTMESNSAKRRKLGHLPNDSPDTTPAGASMLDLASSAGLFRPNTFLLETAELLKEVELNYDDALPGAGEILHKLKGAIESIEPQEPVPVSRRPCYHGVSALRLTGRNL